MNIGQRSIGELTRQYISVVGLTHSSAAAFPPAAPSVWKLPRLQPFSSQHYPLPMARLKGCLFHTASVTRFVEIAAVLLQSALCLLLLRISCFL